MLSCNIWEHHFIYFQFEFCYKILHIFNNYTKHTVYISINSNFYSVFNIQITIFPIKRFFTSNIFILIVYQFHISSVKFRLWSTYKVDACKSAILWLFSWRSCFRNNELFGHNLFISILEKFVWLFSIFQQFYVDTIFWVVWLHDTKYGLENLRGISVEIIIRCFE